MPGTGWRVEHNPTDFPTIVWIYPEGERSLHRLGDRTCPCGVEVEPLPQNPQAERAGIIGVMLSHNRLSAS